MKTLQKAYFHCIFCFLLVIGITFIYALIQQTFIEWALVNPRKTGLWHINQTKQKQLEIQLWKPEEFRVVNNAGSLEGRQAENSKVTVRTRQEQNQTIDGTRSKVAVDRGVNGK